jgi:hypothetical protein
MFISQIRIINFPNYRFRDHNPDILERYLLSNLHKKVPVATIWTRTRLLMLTRFNQSAISVYLFILQVRF